MSLPLSVLDFDSDFLQAPDLGPFVESLGYHRYWFAEHPPQPNAELFVALLAGLTTKLRVGTGGVLLRLRNVAQSAHNFRFLVDAFGDRIDAGFCGGGASQRVEEELSAPASPSNSPQDFDLRADDWIARLRDTPGSASPEIWSLGTGANSAHRAAALGLGYAYSLFHHFSSYEQLSIQTYRERFRPAESAAGPRTMLAVAGLCAPTDEEAERRLKLYRNDFVRPVVWGGQATCEARLASLIERYGPDELIVLDLSPSIEEKMQSYRLWTQVMGSRTVCDAVQASGAVS